MSEDTKGAIRSPRKGTNNNLQNTMHKSTCTYQGKTSYHFVTLSRKSKY